MKKITFSVIAFFAAFTLSAQDNPFVNGMVFDSSSTVCAGDGEGNCNPEASNIELTSQAGITLGENPNEIVITDITGGLYVQAYEAPSGSSATIIVDSENQTLTVTDSPDTVYDDTFNATGSYTVEDGEVTSFTLDWSNGYGDSGTSDFTFNTIILAPGVATNPTPADEATDVAVNVTQDNEGNTVTAVDFGFDAPTTGDAPTVYSVVISNDATFPENTETEIYTISGNFPASTTDFSGIYLPGQQYFETNTTYYWTVTPNNLGGAPADEDVQVWSFTTAGTLGVNDIKANEELTHYNTNEQLTIESASQLETVNLYSILGTQVHTQKLNNRTAIINISQLQAGVYLAQVQVEGKTKTFKFVKK